MNVNQKPHIPTEEFRVVFGSTEIEFDVNKDAINRIKHGYSLESAAYLLERILLPSLAPRPHFVTDGFMENGEIRRMHLTLDDSSHVVLMVTTMPTKDIVRVASFRRAHEKERMLFSTLSAQLLSSHSFIQ